MDGSHTGSKLQSTTWTDSTRVKKLKQVHNVDEPNKGRNLKQVHKVDGSHEGSKLQSTTWTNPTRVKNLNKSTTWTDPTKVENLNKSTKWMDPTKGQDSSPQSGQIP